MELLRQIRVAVIGLPDSGKSTFIKTMLEVGIGKRLSPDTLMREVHWSDGRDPSGNPDTRTIKCAKIIFKYNPYGKNSPVEFCFYDCPGHLEYGDQIKQGISGAHHIIALIDKTREEESRNYLRGINFGDKRITTLYSHSAHNTFPEYDTEEKEGFKDIALFFLNSLSVSYEGIDIEEEALKIIRETLRAENTKACMFFSGGKDSIVGLDLMARENFKGDIYFPRSGYDFKEVEEMIDKISGQYQRPIISFDNRLGNTYENNGSYEMLNAKAEANNRLIRGNRYGLVSVQYRASDEGVRSKDYHLSDKGDHKRFSPVFYFSETNIWRYIAKHNLPICPLYFQGYRSLGDWPITEPCMPFMKSPEEIIKWIDNNPGTAERDGRKSQDNSVDFAMEKLRDNGFF